jgi:UDP-glucose 4-epimerase
MSEQEVSGRRWGRPRERRQDASEWKASPAGPTIFTQEELRMRVLVTGGAGFIGSNLVDAYLDEGHEVIIIDDLSTGKRENINPRATFYKMDIQDPRIEEVFREEKIELVNHHAAQIDVRRSIKDPIFDAKVNVVGLLNLLERSVKYRVKKFIFASSGGVVYGEGDTLPAKETHPLDPLSPYGITKLIAEHYLHYYHTTHHLDYTVLRYGNIYGPRQDPSGEAGVVAIFINNILKGKEPVIFGDGEQLRDYVYIEDAVRANLLCTTKGEGEVFNLGTGVGTSVNALLERIQEIMGTELQPTYKPRREGEIYRNYLDSTKAREILGWQTRVDLDEGLRRTVKFFMNADGSR